MIKKKVIFGCDSRGDGDSPYLTRWTLWRRNDDSKALYLHLFHRSDADELHDHPWAFISVILWRGYVEETVGEWECRTLTVERGEELLAAGEGWQYGGYGVGDVMHLERPTSRRRRRVWPGMVLFRPANWVHRVELVGERSAVTLVLRDPYIRTWGFWTHSGWQSWREYFKERGCW